MRASIIVPFDDDGAERSKHWAWVRERLEALHPDMEIIVARCPAARWTKGLAIEAGALQALGDVLVVMDADVIIPRDDLEEAVRLAHSVPWVVTHGTVWRLAPAPTAALVAREPGSVETYDPRGDKLDRPSYTGVAGGGLVVLHRDAYDAVGPPDRRFVGWGGEDTSWRRALNTLVGPAHRGAAMMTHLWHPPQPDHHDPSPEAKTLAKRYRRAVHKPEAMRALIEEARHGD